MADIAASVLTRLKNKAQASGRSYQLCLQLFCQEEFLRRLEKSKYAENFVLKGGLFIYSLTEFDSRVTVDVDFLLRQMPNTPEQLRVVLDSLQKTSNGGREQNPCRRLPVRCKSNQCSLPRWLCCGCHSSEQPTPFDYPL